MALPDARSAFMAGGLDLIDQMKSGKTFERVILLDGIDAMKAIRRVGGRIVVGALATHAEIADNDLLQLAVFGQAGIDDGLNHPSICDQSRNWKLGMILVLYPIWLNDDLLESSFGEY